MKEEVDDNFGNVSPDISLNKEEEDEQNYDL